MTDTTHGGVTLLAAGQNDKEVTANNAFERLTDKIDQAVSIATADANVALSAAQQQDNGFFRFTGAMTAARTVTFLAGQHKRAAVWNDGTGGFDLTCGYAAGATVTVASGEIVEMQGDGTDFTEIGGTFDIAGLPTSLSMTGAEDYVPFLDSSANQIRRILGDNLPGGGGGGTPVAVADPNGWTTLAAQEASASATIDFTFDPNLYDVIEVELTNVVPANDVVRMALRVSDDNGVSWEATGYFWSTVNGVSSQNPTAYSGGSSAVSGETELSITANIGNASDEGVSGFVHLFGPGDTATHKQITSQNTVLNQNGISVANMAGGAWTGGTGAITGLRFLMTAGNIASGKFVLRGRKKVTSVPDLNLLAQSPDWELIDVQEVTAVAYVDMMFDPNLFDQLLLSGLGVVPNTANQAPALRFSQDGGSTFLAGANDYHWANGGVRSNNSTSPVIFNQSDDASSLILLTTQMGEGSFETMITNFGGGANARTLTVASMERTAGDEGVQTNAARLDANTNAVDALRVLASTGNISGAFILRGRRKITAAPITGGESRILARQTVTSSMATVDFTFDPNLYERVILEAHQVVPVTDSATLSMRVSNDSGVSWEATSYEWSNLYQGSTNNPAIFGGGTSSGASETILIRVSGGVGNAADESGAFIEATLSAPGGDARHKMIRGQGSQMNGTGVLNLVEFAGSWTGGTGSINGLRVLFSTGNIASGRFILRGILKVQ